MEVHSTRAVIRCQEPLTVGLRGAKVHFTFGKSWEGLIRTAVFRQGEKTVALTNIGTEATIPWEVLTQPGLPVQIGLYGSAPGGKLVIPTVWAGTEPVRPGTDPEADPSAEPTPGLWEQFQSKLGSMEEALNEANRPVRLIVVTQNKAGGYDTTHDVAAIDGLMAAEVPFACYWYDKDMVLHLDGFQAGVAFEFAAVYQGTEYRIGISHRGVACTAVELAKKSDIPSKVSDLTNDSGFLTSAPVASVNGRTGAVAVSVPIRVTVEQNADGSFTSDLSHKELLELHNAGNALYCQQGNRVLSLAVASKLFFAFCCVYSGSVHTVTVSSAAVTVNVTPLASGGSGGSGGLSIWDDGEGNVTIDTAAAVTGETTQ